MASTHPQLTGGSPVTHRALTERPAPPGAPSRAGLQLRLHLLVAQEGRALQQLLRGVRRSRTYRRRGVQSLCVLDGVGKGRMMKDGKVLLGDPG